MLDCDDYFERLWTVYELSSFLLRSRCEFAFLPVNLPFTVCTMSLATTPGIKSTFVHELAPWMATLEQFAAPLMLLPMFISLHLVQRMWAREQSRRLRRLESFSISTAECSSEDDSAPVEHNIAQLLQDLGHTAVDDDRADASHIFDETVRENLPQAMKDRMCIPRVFF